MSSPLVFRCEKCGAMNRIALLVPDRQAVCGRCKENLATSGLPQQVGADELERAIAASPAVVVVDFWAPWCAPCRAFAPVLEQFARETAGRFVVLKVDTERSPQAGARHGIQAIPTLVVFRSGKEVERTSGAMPLADLHRFVEQAAFSIG
jgi:thioredoxin 2